MFYGLWRIRKRMEVPRNVKGAGERLGGILNRRIYLQTPHMCTIQEADKSSTWKLRDFRKLCKKKKLHYSID